MTQWDQKTLEFDESEVPTGSPLVLDMSRPIPGGRLAHQIRLYPYGTSIDPREWWSAFARVICHVLVNEIPDRGLPELCESLSDMYQFCLEQPPQPPVLPTVPRMQATLGQARERPGFRLETDD